MQIVLILRYLSLRRLSTTQYNGGEWNLVYDAHMKNSNILSQKQCPCYLDNPDLTVNSFHRDYISLVQSSFSENADSE